VFDKASLRGLFTREQCSAMKSNIDGRLRLRWGGLVVESPDRSSQGGADGEQEQARV
jgi:hypothetical protein